MTTADMHAEALARAVNSNALTNYGTIFEGFSAKGIPEDQIVPRENVFTYNAWKALGRQVRKGEHGVRVSTWIPIKRTNETTGERETAGRMPRSTTVFHVSQTDPIVK